MEKKIILGLILVIISGTVLSQQKISSEEIINLLREGKECKISDKEINGELDFTDVAKKAINLEELSNRKPSSKETVTTKTHGISEVTYFYKDVNNIQIKKAITFTNCVFTDELQSILITELKKGNKIFDIANHTVFEEKVVFENCIFKGDLNLDQTIFEDELIFEGCSFKKVADFNEATFEKKISIKNCVFQSPANFMDAVFSDELMLDQSSFESSIVFNRSKFARTPDFSKAEFNSSVHIKECMVKEDLLNWIIEDQKEIFSASFLSNLHKERFYYPVSYNIKNNITINSSKSSTGDLKQNRLNLLESEIIIPDQEGKWIVTGRTIWDQRAEKLMVSKADLKNPDGKIIYSNKNLIIDLNDPLNFVIE